MIRKIFRMVSKFIGMDGTEINTIYYALDKDGFSDYKKALPDDVQVVHGEVLGVYASDGLYQRVEAAGGLLGVECFPEGDLSEAFSSKNGRGILNIRDPFWYKDNVQEDIPVNPRPTQKESVMSTARAKAQPSAVASAASQVAATASKAVSGSADDSAPNKTIPMSKVMEAAASAAKAVAESVASSETDPKQMAEAVVETTPPVSAETQSPQPVAEQQSTTMKETTMSDKPKTEDKTKAEDKKTDKGFMAKTKNVLTGPTAKAVGLVLLATAAGAAGGYGAVEMQRRRQMAAKGRMA